MLDVGGGTGRIAIPLITKELRLWSLTYHAKCSRRLARNPASLSTALIVQADAESLPFRDRATFGLVTDTALAEIVSVLRTAGALLAGVDNRYSLAAEVLDLEFDVKKAEGFVKKGVGHYPEGWGGHLVKVFTADELEKAPRLA